MRPFHRPLSWAPFPQACLKLTKLAKLAELANKPRGQRNIIGRRLCAGLDDQDGRQLAIAKQQAPERERERESATNPSAK